MEELMNVSYQALSDENSETFLIKKAIKMGSEDNITCLFLGFDNFEKHFNINSTVY